MPDLSRPITSAGKLPGGDESDHHSVQGHKSRAVAQGGKKEGEEDLMSSSSI